MISNKDSFFDPPMCEVNSTNYISNFGKSQGTFGGLRMNRGPLSKEGSIMGSQVMDRKFTNQSNNQFVIYSKQSPSDV